MNEREDYYDIERGACEEFIESSMSVLRTSSLLAATESLYNFSSLKAKKLFA